MTNAPFWREMPGWTLSFLGKKTAFTQASLFKKGRSSYVMALGIHTKFMNGPLSSATHHMTLSIACESFTNGMHVLPYTNAVYYAPMWNKCKWSTGICREKFRGQHCTSMLSSCSSYVVSVDLIFSNCKLVRFVWDCLDFRINV